MKNNPTPSPGETTVNRLLTIPNVLCAVRLLGAPVLVILAIAGMRDVFIGLYIFLAMTDWVDGKLAIWLDQRTQFGARLDSWADAALYAALLLGMLQLSGDSLMEESAWVIAALSSYAATMIMGFWKFRRWPSYHTRAAKISWFLMTVGAVCLVAQWDHRPFRLAMVAGTLTNIEAFMISCVLRSWHVNVPSVYHAYRTRRGEQCDT